MPWSLFLAAVGLLFVFEGVLPVLLPQYWRRWVMRMLEQSDRSLRIMGMISMLLGLGLIILARYLFH